MRPIHSIYEELLMSTIQVYNPTTQGLLGTGQGTISKPTAQIDTWDKGKKAGLILGKKYTLKSSGKTYSDAECTVIGLPATFSDLQ